MKRNLIVALCAALALALACAAALAEAPSAPVRATETLVAGFEAGADPCARTFFDESTGEGQLVLHGDGVSCEFLPDGMLISGKCADVNAASATIRKRYDFGEAGDGAPVIRVSIDAVARLGAHMSVAMYLDEEPEPFVRKQIPTQSEVDAWGEEIRVFCELDAPIYGEHYVTLAVEDASTTPSKNTALMLRGIRFYRGNLPVVYVDIDESLGAIEAMNADEVHQTRCYGSVTIAVPEGYDGGYDGGRYAGGTYALEYIRGRGESTWSMPKKPYKLKFESGADLFGMGKNKNWALIANYFDRSFVRNRMTYALGDRLGMPYTPQLVPVEVVMNGEYLGLYYLSENVRVGESRVDIDDLEDYAEGDDITGGYLLATRRPYDEEPEYKFTTRLGNRLLIDSPEALSDGVPGERLDEMRAYIIDYVNGMEAALFGEGFRDEGGAPYTDYMDLESAAKDFLIQEFSMNRDAFLTSSSFFYKPRGGKLYWGPLWDFDYVAWGSDSWDSYRQEDDLAAQEVREFFCAYAWVMRLREDPAFCEAVRAAWGGPDVDDPGTLFFQLNEMIRDGGVLDQYEAELAICAENNADVPESMNDVLAEIDEEVEFNAIGDGFHDEIWRLKRWIRNRMDWFDANLDSLQITDYMVDLSFYSDGELLETRAARRYEELTDLPVPEAGEGRYFAGWYGDVAEEDPETGEMVVRTVRVAEGFFLRGDMALNARWIGADDPILPEAVFLRDDAVYGKRKDFCDLTVTVLPEGADETVFFESSDPEVANVTGDGRVFLLAESGDAVITVRTVNGIQAQCAVHIIDEDSLSSDIFGFSADETAFTLKRGEYRKVALITDPMEAEPQSFRILNGDPDVAFMTAEGVVVAREPGTARIFVVHNQVEDAVEIVVTVTGD